MAKAKEKEVMKAVPKSKIIDEGAHSAGIEADGGMGKKTWTGSLMVGVINIPVAMFAAARGERIGFNMLHKLCKSKVKQSGYYCRCCVEVQAVEAFEFTPGNFIPEHPCGRNTRTSRKSEGTARYALRRRWSGLAR